ncbi:MAG: hypothetical protein K0R23_3636 [Lacrimispora sp.]|jgi:hypothetical protein|nr:hypothetical protein [Lacrimispora sp.]
MPGKVEVKRMAFRKLIPLTITVPAIAVGALAMYRNHVPVRCCFFISISGPFDGVWNIAYRWLLYIINLVS